MMHDVQDLKKKGTMPGVTDITSELATYTGDIRVEYN